MLPFERGLPRALIDLVRSPGELTARWRTDPESESVAPMQVYLACAALGLGTTALLGEANTGALYVLGGGVFGKVERWGAWLAFVLTVPILATCLRVAYARLPLRFEDHLTFALHFQSFVFLCITVETAVIAVLPPEGAPQSVADYAFLIVAAVYYFLAQRDGFDRPLGDVVARGFAATVGYGLVFIAAAVALASMTGFRL